MRNYRDGDLEVLHSLCPGAVMLDTLSYGVQMWIQASRGQRRPHKCCRCDALTANEDRLWRPFGNPQNRMHRMCPQCMAKLIEEA